MTLLNRLASIVRWIVRRDRAETQLDDELQTYVETSAAEKMREGIARDDAFRLARMELGGVEQVKERVRTERHGHLLDEIGRDVRYAVRMFASQRAFTAVLLVTLALGIGANTAIFSLIDALMLRELPVLKPRELVLVNLRGRTDLRSGGETLSYAIVRALDDRRDIFSGVAGFSASDFDVGPSGSVARVHGALVTGDFFAMLGLVPAAGRLLTSEDDRPGAELVAIISDGYWQRQLAGSTAAIGATLVVNGKPARIVGVTPAGFSGAYVGSEPDVTLVVAMLPRIQPSMAALIEPGNFWLRVLARRAPGVSVERAGSALNAIWPSLVDQVISKNWTAERRASMAELLFVLEPGATGGTYLRQLYAKPLYVLMAVAGLVLLVACANIASLVLARASTRQREFAIRLAIGAGRGRVVRQLIIEGIVLSLAGAALGVGIAWLSSRFLVSLMSSGRTPIAFDLTPNWHVLAFSMAVATATGILFGLAPALQMRRTTELVALRNDSRTTTGRSTLLPSLVSVQVALSLVLVAGAGLFVRTLVNLRRIDLGFSADTVLVVTLDRDVKPRPDRLLDVVRAIPGVVSAGVGTHTPLDGSSWTEAIVPVGQPMPSQENARIIGASPQFLQTLQVPVVAGRAFTPADVAGAPGVAIINQRYAERYFPRQNPLGQHLVSTLMGEPADLEIVGLVKNTATNLRRTVPSSIVYVPFAQFGLKHPPSLVIRTSGTSSAVVEAVRAALRGESASSPVEVRALDVQVNATILQERMVALLAAAFGALALLLSSIGLYGLLAYSVARRSREIGVRIALGATTGGVVRLVVLNGARLVAVGLLIGYPVARFASRFVEGMLFGLRPSDPIVMTTAVTMLVGAALLASFLPARRASRVDPVVTLRHE